MKHFEYYKYFSGDPLDPFLNEGKGIPNDLKWIVDEKMFDIDLNKIQYRDYDEYNFKVKNLSINFHHRKIIDMYATSRFGIYSQKVLKSPIIEIWLDFDNYEKVELKRVILHELLHIYEIYQRCKNMTKRDIQWYSNNILYKIRNRYTKDELLKELIFIIYLTNDAEIGARVAEVYTILMDNRSSDKDFLITELKKTNAWRRLNDIKEFDYKKYEINNDVCKKFFIEYNTEVHKKLVKNFDNDILKILNAYQILFEKKSKEFEKKLLRIVDEVIFDVNNIQK